MKPKLGIRENINVFRVVSNVSRGILSMLWYSRFYDHYQFIFLVFSFFVAYL